MEMADILDLINILVKNSVLDLSGYQLSSLPPEIGNLTNLTELNLMENQLSSLPPEIGNLTNLTELNLYENKLSSLPPEIGNLTNLIGLSLGENKLSSLPPEIGNLTNLTGLFLEGNQLSSLPPEIGNLTNLTGLYLYGNKLRSLPPELSKLMNLTMLDLENNPLESPPPEIVERGIKAIFEYLKQLPEPEKVIIHNEAKLLLVGQGDVGKTCIKNRLIHDEFIEDKSTQGIDISEWKIVAPTAEQEQIKLNIWDFGGQEIYHATHQFFLTKRSIYLLVWNARRAKDYEHIYYWLQIIDAFGENSPIILVLSKLNERDDDLNMKDLKEQFPQIVDMFKIDSEDGNGFPNLKDIITRTAWHLPHMRTPWGESWFKVREQLEQNGRNWITYNEFHQICEKEKLDQKQTDTLDEYLHDLGVIIHFRDRIALKNMVILKPDWATKAFYRILDTPFVRQNGGVLPHDKLEQIWDIKIYPQEIHPKILELMNKFELVYELPDKRSHLVAELLPSTESKLEWDNTNNLCFYYRYDFLPAGVITRFIVRVHQVIERRPDGTQLCWREGVVLQRENTRAFVKVKKIERLIEIKINGDNKRELLAVIRHEFSQINRSIKRIKIDEEIPCNCSIDCTYKFEYGKLLKAEKAGKGIVQCHDSWDDVPLSLLLDGYEKKENRIKNLDSKDSRISIHAREVIMRDQYKAGQVGAQGPGAHAHDITFNQIWNENKDDIDLLALAMELNDLRLRLKKEATKPEHDIFIGAITSAEGFAREKNGPKTLEYLSKAGKWTLDIATKIGVPVATEALKKALGL
ncbi:COR domain-containing protein [Candidatus Methanoperedens sp. BLZ2]|uniref:COR domain-containing protein n=1 Tax=Candidatus Methanoperedens sp. BLZ2 TaxID=2035255 RepID=UPI000BE2DEA9|nr:COR domain-containing protein [Candidatus Methanoperedens sp. BLZ2]KAB2946425.1 MAG: GTP-binding protein [Candidatus Methanoperedens sp.]MBZ0175661.1 leucine-rich repeat domain-containing protein [Candidatus Methanoperedens nitroreducens]WAH95068.1 MAG: leucine-rich repeat domain-containing protein [Candidatus Methanoperedens sp.]